MPEYRDPIQITWTCNGCGNSKITQYGPRIEMALRFIKPDGWGTSGNWPTGEPAQRRLLLCPTCLARLR